MANRLKPAVPCSIARHLLILTSGWSKALGHSQTPSKSPSSPGPWVPLTHEGGGRAALGSPCSMSCHAHSVRPLHPAWETPGGESSGSRRKNSHACKSPARKGSFLECSQPMVGAPT